METNWLKGGIDLIHHLGASNQASRSMSGHHGFRRVVKVYEPGEEIPRPGKKQKVKQTLPTAPIAPKESSVTLFNSLMAEIVKSKKKSRIALEGARLIEDALLTNLQMEKLFILKSIEEVPEKIKVLMSEDVEIHRLGQKHMQLWSSVTTPPGIIGIFSKPTIDTINAWNESQTETNLRKLPLTLICDNLREPGNLGSILRSAAGAGCKKVLLSLGCVDPWETKVLRGGSGAQFRLPIITEISMHEIGRAMEVECSSCLNKVTLPSVGIFLADSDVNESSKFGIPSVSYTEVDYTKFKEIYLLVGGETEGIGDDTLQIVSSLKTSFLNSGVLATFSRIHISLRNRIESLNVANATGILVFEIRRQLDQKYIMPL